MRDSLPTAQNETNEIVFLTFRIDKDSVSKTNKLTLTNKTKSAGKFKKTVEDKPHHANFLTLEVFTKGKPSQTIVIEHPLFKHLEYTDKDNKYAFKDAEVDTEEFFVRIQTNGSDNSVLISETLQNSQKRILLTLNL